MQKPKKPVFYMLLFTGLILFIFLVMQGLEIYFFHENIAVLFPKGLIALKERNLLLLLQALMLLVIIPVYILTFIFSWKYRCYNRHSTYDPDLTDNVVAEYIWWGIPLVLTAIIGVLTWYKTHELDPFKPIESDRQTMTIQAVALQWKWLFIYPEEGVASLNFVQFPKDTPIRFEITADAPMNSLWIPHLAGQIYAMPSMRTELNLMADTIGDYRGSSANLSGEGFAGMHFITRVSSDEDYKQWLASAKSSSNTLDLTSYKALAAPSKDNLPEIYQLNDATLFDQIIMKYMHPQEK